MDDMYIIHTVSRAVHKVCGVDWEGASELRSCVKMEVHGPPALPSLINLRFFVDVEQHLTNKGGHLCRR